MDNSDSAKSNMMSLLSELKALWGIPQTFSEWYLEPPNLKRLNESPITFSVCESVWIYREGMISESKLRSDLVTWCEKDKSCGCDL